MGFSLVLDILVAGLLVITISYAVMLNRRLRVMRQDKADLEKLAAKFADSTMRAEESITHLRRTADDLKKRIDAAQSLRDDLAFLIDRGGSTADRLEEDVRAAREKSPPGPRKGKLVKGKKERPSVDDSKSDAERELIRALQSAR
ncbi:MAG: hypothetical protein HN403_04380 [Rhodospirillales bacterium]|nr:hypothetical protein [Rhodospirillales bacterium]